MSPRTQKRATPVPHPRVTEPKPGTAAEQRPEGGGVTVPVVHTRVGMPHLGFPSAASVPGRLLWLGGLGTLAVVGVLDWPVAAAVAAGTWVAEQRARERLRQEREEHPAEAAGGR
ncbi:MAG TPA: hypothetical protein VLW53_22835 [Candidatus Eisenbacteria bacterium]|nr:hypothetical protein [Candidatus Eisenbacteria bacterium]